MLDQAVMYWRSIARSLPSISSSPASDLIAVGRLSVRNVSCEELVLAAGEDLYNLAFAVRVGALDGRHPDAGARAMEQLARALVSSGRVYVDGGDPQRELTLGLTVPDRRVGGDRIGPPGGGAA